MLIALISDIHANYQALQEVIKHARANNAEAFWCLGDVFGRGPAPFDVWYELTNVTRPQYWVAGNHDWGLAGIIENYFLPDGSMGGDFGNRDDWKAILLQRGFLTLFGQYDKIELEIKKKWRVMVSPLEGVYLAHGSFGGLPEQTPMRWQCVTGYLDRIDWIQASWNNLRNFVTTSEQIDGFECKTHQWTPPRLMIVGHTHRRGLFRFQGNWYEENIEENRESPKQHKLRLSPETPVLINPGSVGFPRQGPYDHCASYALLDWDGQDASVTFHRVPYNRTATRDLMKYLEFPKGLLTLLGESCSLAHAQNCPCKG